MTLTVALAIAVALLSQQPVYGRWDLTVHDTRGEYPMWLELVPGTPATGRLQRRTGHAMPLGDLVIDGPRVRFTLPSDPPVPGLPVFTATVDGDRLTGELTAANGSRVPLSGVRAPRLDRAPRVSSGRAIQTHSGVPPAAGLSAGVLSAKTSGTALNKATPCARGPTCPHWTVTELCSAAPLSRGDG